MSLYLLQGKRSPHMPYNVSGPTEKVPTGKTKRLHDVIYIRHHLLALFETNVPQRSESEPLVYNNYGALQEASGVGQEYAQQEIIHLQP